MREIQQTLSARGSGRLASAAGCEQRWYYDTFRKIRAGGEKQAADIGTLAHKFLAWHFAGKMETPPEWFRTSTLERDLDSTGIERLDWRRQANDIFNAYMHHYNTDTFEPLAVEDELRVRIGDLDRDGQDEPAFVLRGPDGVIHEFPSLSDEQVIFRMDMVVRIAGEVFVYDWKTESAGRNSDRLAIVAPDKPLYKHYWQQLCYLHAARTLWPETKGIVLDRMKRTVPFDFARTPIDVPEEAFAAIPRTLRALAKRERELRVKAITSPEKLVQHFWSCEDGYGCPYKTLCFAKTQMVREETVASAFVGPGIAQTTFYLE